MKNTHENEIDFSKENEDTSTPQKVLPNSLTSYDLLKTIAILLMVIDHIGIYFYPDESWFRVLGRLCVPIWFFLIGYARTRDIPFKVILGVGILMGSNMLAGEFLFPVTILVTLMIGRYYIDTWMFAARRGGEAMAGLFFMLLLLTFPTFLIFEYGTLGLLFTVFGALCRYKQDYKNEMPEGFERQILYFAAGSFVVFVMIQIAPFKVLTGIQLSVLCLSMAGVYFILNRFAPAELPTITSKLPSFINEILKFTGRKTLEIYVVHLLMFKAAAVFLYPDRFQFLQWNWTHENTQKFIAFIFSH